MTSVLPILKEPVGRTIREEASFTESAAKLGSTQWVDAALQGILDAISRRPEGFDVVKGHEPIQLAKTDYIERKSGDVVPALRLWFISENDTTVALLYVEEIPNDEE